MSKENFAIHHDQFSKKRGGNSYIYEISCSNCMLPILIYQKDGKGALVRCYSDRIFVAQNLEGLEDGQYSNDVSEFNSLKCNNCHSLIGTAFTYRPENRLAFQMIKGAYTRKPYKQ